MNPFKVPNQTTYSIVSTDGYLRLNYELITLKIWIGGRDFWRTDNNAFHDLTSVFAL